MKLNCRNTTGYALLLLLFVPTGCVTTSRSPEPEATPSPDPAILESKNREQHEALAKFLKPKGFTIDSYNKDAYSIYITAPRIAIYANRAETKEFALEIRNMLRDYGYDRQIKVTSPEGQVLAETDWKE